MLKKLKLKLEQIIMFIRTNNKCYLRGFTLLESIVVLIIAGLITTMGYQGRQLHLQNEEQKFWQEFDLNWRNMQTEVQGTNKLMLIKFGMKEIKIINTTGEMKTEIRLPESLEITNKGSAITLGDGINNTQQKITFRSKIANKIYTFNCGIGWGMYEIEPVPKGLYRT